jgi:hypothetical protein
MAKPHPKQSGRLPGFVAMSWDLLNSPAYRSLSHSAAKALPYFLGKPKRPFNDRQYFETEFPFPYGEAERHGFARATFFRILCELTERGFIDPVDKGGLRGDGKSVSRFKVSKRWEEFGDSGFKTIDFRQFKPRRN